MRRACWLIYPLYSQAKCENLFLRCNFSINCAYYVLGAVGWADTRRRFETGAQRPRQTDTSQPPRLPELQTYFLHKLQPGQGRVSANIHYGNAAKTLKSTRSMAQQQHCRLMKPIRYFGRMLTTRPDPITTKIGGWGKWWLKDCQNVRRLFQRNSENSVNGLQSLWNIAQTARRIWNAHVFCCVSDDITSSKAALEQGIRAWFYFAEYLLYAGESLRFFSQCTV